MEFVDLFRRNIPRDVLDQVPDGFVLEHRVIALEDLGDTLVVATADIENQELFEMLRFILNRQVRPVLATETAIDFAIGRYYGQQP